MADGGGVRPPDPDRLEREVMGGMA